MTTKRLSCETTEEEPLGKRGCSEMASMDDLDAELDDEVEKELREFEQLQCGLLGETAQQQNVEIGATKESREGNNESGSDMEVDEDLQQEIAESKKINPRTPTQKIDQASNQPSLDGTECSNIRVLPETFGEENLRGDDLLEKSGSPADGEEACVEIEQVRLYKDLKAIDPLMNPGDANTTNFDANAMKPRNPSLRTKPEQFNVNSKTNNWTPGPFCSILQTRKQKPNKEEEEEDSDFPSKRKPRSRGTIICSKPQQHKSLGTEHDSPQQLENKLPWQVQAPATKTSFQDRVIQIPLKTTARSESEISKLLPGSSLKENGTFHNTPLVLKEAFVGPVLKIPVQPKSATTAVKDAFVNQILKKVVQFKSSSNQDLSFRDPIFDNPKPSCSTSQPKSPVKGDPKQPESLPGTPRLTEFTIDITSDPPVEYCVIELVMHRRYKQGYLLDDEKFELLEARRPSISCPDLHPYAPYYDKQLWLAACNELIRFYCWPCLLFSSKVIWSVTCYGRSETAVARDINKHIQSLTHQECLKQRDAWSLKKKFSIIKTLLSNNFVDGTWSDENQEAIILKGRPCPILEGRTERKSKADKKAALEAFYSRVNWICGCTSSEKFYCWPCTLFCRSGASAEEFTYAGTIESADAAVLQHQMSPKHMDTCLKLGKWEFDMKKKSEEKKEEIEKTRILLKYIVEVLCAEKKKINNTELSAVDYVDSLEIMSEYNRSLKNFIDEKRQKSTNTLAKTVALYAPAILDSVEYFIKSGILNEIQNSNFISLIFDHSSGLSHKAILSVIARYVDENGRVHERFIKLLNVGYNTPSTALSDEFFQTISELQCRSTLVGFTYDGYLVKPDEIPEFNAKVRKLCPDAKFFHYNEHSFNRVLLQTISHMPDFRAVLHVVRELANFFESTPGARKSLLDIIRKNETSERDEFCRSPDFIRIVFKHHNIIVEIMEKISENARDWKVKTVVQAKNFLEFLNEAKNRFFITVTARIFKAVEELNEALDTDDRNEDVMIIACRTVAKINDMCRNFNSVLDTACSHLEGNICWGDTRKEMSRFREHFTDVVRCVVKLIKNRIVDQELGYFKISQSSTPLSTDIKLKRQNLFLQNLSLPLKFSSTKLTREMNFFHSASVFADLALTEIVSRMNSYNMISALPEFHKFLQLALTVPIKSYDDSTIPAVHRISAYVEGKKDLNSTDALLWMEKEFLTDLQKGENFYGQVTDRVLSITKTAGFAKATSKT